MVDMMKGATKGSTVTFLGKEVSIARAEWGPVGDEAQRTLWLSWHLYQTPAMALRGAPSRRHYVAMSTGPLNGLGGRGEGSTPQAATSRCEKDCVKKFGRIVGAMGRDNWIEAGG